MYWPSLHVTVPATQYPFPWIILFPFSPSASLPFLAWEHRWQKDVLTFHPQVIFRGMRSENCWKISISLAPLLAMHGNIPKPKKKFLSGELGLVQPKMLLVPLNVTPGTQFHWILIVNLPNSVRKEGKELPFPREFCYSPVNSVLHVWCSPLRSPPHNVLSSAQRTPKRASKIVQPRPLSRRVK